MKIKINMQKIHAYDQIIMWNAKSNHNAFFT